MATIEAIRSSEYKGPERRVQDNGYGFIGLDAERRLVHLHNDEKVTTESVIPSVETNIFAGHEASRLAVGIVAVGEVVMPNLENEYRAYSLLRGNVYAKQKKYMPESKLNADGTETDSDDERSVHFAVIENGIKNSRVIGAMRLIVKSEGNNDPLPVEAHYPEVFADGPASMLSTEASRLIGRHENGKLQRSLKWLLFTAGVAYVKENKLGPVYGAVERSVARGLQIEGMPVDSLGEPKFIEEFNATKLPIRIDLPRLTQKIETDRPGLLNDMHVLSNRNFVYSGKVEDVPSKSADKS